MKIRKYLIAVFIVFSLSFSYQPVSFYSREKESVVFVLNSSEDIFTCSFIRRNEVKRSNVLISLTIRTLIRNTYSSYADSS